MTVAPADPSRTYSWTRHRSGSPPVDELLRVLALAPAPGTDGPPVFTGTSASRPPGRVFGGQMLAQSVVAASLTVGVESAMHSLHAYFVLAGRPDVPFRFQVETLRDGRSFHSRRVDALQDGRLVCTATVSFHSGRPTQDGIRHHNPMPNIPGPHELPGYFAFHNGADGEPRRGAVEVRPCPDEPHADEPGLVDTGTPPRTESAVWLRIAADLPDDPMLHQALVVYLSDLSILRGAFRAHRLERNSTRSASLDHAIWLHRNARADEWMLYRSRSPWGGSDRAVGNAALYTAAGDPLAHAGQEMVVRVGSVGGS